MYVLSHRCLLNSYKAFFYLHTWFFLSCVSTPTGCKCLFVVYALFSWEASCYESFLVSHDVSIYYMMELRTSLQVSILYPRHHSSWTGTLLPFLIGYFFIAGRLYIIDVTQHCHITRVCLRPLEASWFYSSFWIISWTIVTCSLEQVSSFFSCRRLYAIFPTSQMH